MTPSWYPFIGNYFAVSKVASVNEKSGLGRTVMATLPSELFKHQHNILPTSYCINCIYEGGLLVFNSCSALELIHSNKAHVDKSEDYPKILKGFGASAYYFSQAN